MDPNHPNYANRYQRNTNSQQNTSFQPNSSSQQNPNYQPNSNSQQDTNNLFNPNVINIPQFLAMFQAFMNQNTIQSSSQGTLCPTSPQVEPHPTTTGRDGSSTRMPFEYQYPTQSLADDEDEVQVHDIEVISGNKGGKKDRWNPEEDKHLVSSYLYCSGDPVEATDRQKGALWAEIKESYDVAVAKKLNVLHKRSMKALKRRWGQINEAVTFWVSQLGEAERLRASGYVVNDVEAKAHELYVQKREGGQPFTFYHCWVGMQHLPRWMLGKVSTAVSQGSSKGSSDEVGMPKRPDGVKKVKAQNKMKGVAATCMDKLNNKIGGLKDERGLMRKGMSDMLEYQKQRDQTKLRFKTFQMLMTKSHPELKEEYLAKLKEEFLK